MDDFLITSTSTAGSEFTTYTQRCLFCLSALILTRH
ncbi:hypothetical protein BWP06_27835, partial [Enterobacter cloacae]